MACFWTDLVGSTQQCGAGGLFARVGNINALGSNVSAFAVVDKYIADFATSEPTVLFISAAIDNTGEFFPASAAEEYSNVVYLGYTVVGGLSTFEEFRAFSISSEAVRFPATPASDLVVSATLSVSELYYVHEWACTAGAVGLSVSAGFVATAEVSSLGVLRVALTNEGTLSGVYPPSGGGFVGTALLRIVGTATGESGTTIPVDFWGAYHNNGCS